MVSAVVLNASDMNLVIVIADKDITVACNGQIVSASILFASIDVLNKIREAISVMAVQLLQVMGNTPAIIMAVEVLRHLLGQPILAMAIIAIK